MTQSGFRAVAVGGAIAAATLMLAGCATEEYVQQQVAPVQAQASQAQGTAAEALARANAAHKLAEGKFLYEEVLSDDAVKFPVNGDELSEEAKARLSTLVGKLKSDNRNVYLEIQGFTDASGNSKYNHKLGESRAEAVRTFLHRQGVPLNRMSIISYGEEDPVASNDTAEGRAQNRRVTIVVLA